LQGHPFEFPFFSPVVGSLRVVTDSICTPPTLDAVFFLVTHSFPFGFKNMTCPLFFTARFPVYLSFQIRCLFAEIRAQ